MVPVRPNLAALARDASAIPRDFRRVCSSTQIMAQLSSGISQLTAIRLQFPTIPPMSRGWNRQGQQATKNQASGNDTF
jgi:hypothetical protein